MLVFVSSSLEEDDQPEDSLSIEELSSMSVSISKSIFSTEPFDKKSAKESKDIANGRKNSHKY